MFWIRDQFRRKHHEVAANSEGTKINGYCGEIAICSSPVPRKVSAALFRRSGIGSVGFSVLFMRIFLTFCSLSRSLQSKSTFSEWNAKFLRKRYRVVREVKQKVSIRKVDLGQIPT